MTLLLLCFPAASSFAENLIASLAESGEVLSTSEIARGEGWCVLWRHSVQGFEVADCYVNRGGNMVLDRSRLPDFAAGLDHIPGRGVQVSDGMGGYWIKDIDEPVPGNSYILRPGSMKVDHRLKIGRTVISLSATAPHKRVRIALVAGQDQ